MTTGLFIGRFQPFHNAHLQDVKDILAKHDKVIIVVGSTQESRTDKNPYTFEEREDFITKALADADITAFEIVNVPDINDNARWVAHLESFLNETYEEVFSGNELVIELFEQAGKQVTKIKLIDEVSSTKIRSLMSEDKEWQHLVPKAVSEALKTIRFKNNP